MLESHSGLLIWASAEVLQSMEEKEAATDESQVPPAGEDSEG